MNGGVVVLTKEARIKILLKTLPDAIEQQGFGAEGRSEFSSRALQHVSLWRDGSYAELTRKLLEMQAQSKSVRWHTTGYYTLALPRARRRMAEIGLRWLVREMDDVFVPAELTENAGFLPSEARWAARPGLRRAA